MGLILKLRKKLYRAYQTYRGDDTSKFRHRWTPAFKLQYLIAYRKYLPELRKSIYLDYEEVSEAMHSSTENQ